MSKIKALFGMFYWVIVMRFALTTLFCLWASCTLIAADAPAQETLPEQTTPSEKEIPALSAKDQPLSVKDQQGVDFFENKIRPVLIEHCYECHSAKSEEVGGGLLLDTRQGMRAGGESGPALTPGNPKESLLISSMEYRDLEMPPSEKLPDDVLNRFLAWVRMGAPDPRKGMSKPKVVDEKKPVDLWSIKPIQLTKPPEVNDGEATPIDRFVIARLKAEQLEQVQTAKPNQLLRRLYFDMIGLPPSPEEIAAFEADHSEDAYRRVVDRLLKSPQFGERWGRHWFDVARYAESAGNSRDVLMPHAWRYRDYVIDALNQDVPYDRFIREQIAGDLLEADDAAERQRLQIATGFLAVGSKSLNGGNTLLDMVDDQIDVVSKAVLGLTVSCARCHDHKFDPIPTADYYAMAGIFRSTETLYGGGTNRPKNAAAKRKVYLQLISSNEEIDPKEQAELEASLTEANQQVARLDKRAAAQIKRLPKDWAAQKKALLRANKADGKKQASQARNARLLKQIEVYEKTQKQLAKAKQNLAELSKNARSVEFAIGVRDAKKIADFPIQVRGDRTKAGPIAPRGFLSCVETQDAIQIEGAKQSGRLELAQWLTQTDHPLTARVAVNRIWQHLFGEGLVATVDNFGVNGEPPSHPKLLDFLAHQFVHQHKWSQKQLIREIVLTKSYRLSTDHHDQAIEKDPGNRLLWRHSRRRLEAEPIRDAMLTAAGELDLKRPTASLVTKIGEGEVGRNIDTSHLEKPFPHRSVYLPIIRTLLPDFLRKFDLPEPSNPQGVRDSSNVPAQALFFMNSQFALDRAEAFSKRICNSTSDRDGRIELAFRIALGRGASDAELESARDFLESVLDDSTQESKPSEQDAWMLFCQSLFGASEFRYID